MKVADSQKAGIPEAGDWAVTSEPLALCDCVSYRWMSGIRFLSFIYSVRKRTGVAYWNENKIQVRFCRLSPVTEG